MKAKYFSLALAAFAACSVMTSCEDQPDAYKVAGGKPSVDYIRCLSSEVVGSNDAADTQYTNGQLVTSAYPGSNICLVGSNLRSVYEMFFNDKKAVLNTSYITDNTLVVSIPDEIPGAVTDKIYMVTKAKDTVTVDFKVIISAPTLNSIACEYAKVGEQTVIYGRYFIDDPTVPLTVSFQNESGGLSEAKINKVSEDFTTMTISVPEDAAEGSILVTSVYGTTKSVFRYKDSRGMITNFDGEGNSGTKGIVPQGWNLAITYSEDGGIDGYYAQVGPATLDETGAWQESLKMSWWCGNWGGDPMSIMEGPGAPLRNIFPAGYFNDPSSLALKFELCIPSSNPWMSGALQVLFVNNEQCANDTWQNNTYIHTKANGGLSLCRGLYRPWAETGSFDTGDKWITVTMPLSEFTYDMDGSTGDVALSPESFDSFTIWPLDGGIAGAECNPIFRYDNIRLVPLK